MCFLNSVSGPYLDSVFGFRTWIPYLLGLLNSVFGSPPRGENSPFVWGVLNQVPYRVRIWIPYLDSLFEFLKFRIWVSRWWGKLSLSGVLNQISYRVRIWIPYLDPVLGFLNSVFRSPPYLWGKLSLWGVLDQVVGLPAYGERLSLAVVIDYNPLVWSTLCGTRSLSLMSVLS